ncbi:alginate export family protein [Sphingomonas sp. MMS12-HWE2-04]|uniref:alginate export family protein n=1 Tax=Sphingomonas sp. MMS12-HWE2-04 TaxID=3234199 RepID=UPI00384CF04C
MSLLVLVLGLASPAAAQTEPHREAWQAPTLTNARFDESYESLADPELRAAHWTGRLKYVPLAADAWLTTGVELRARVESFDNNLWGSGPAPDDGYLWLRALPYADLHVGTGKLGFRAFVQPVAAYAIGMAPAASPLDQTRLDLLQGFADIHLGGQPDTGITLRAGRQMVPLGTERLIGTRYGPNVPLAFDGFRAIVSLPGATVSMIAVRPVKPGSGSFDDTRSRTKSLWGAYASLANIGIGSGLDLYYLGYRNTAATFGGRSGSELRHSVGARLFGASSGWHWNVEGVAQFGSFAGSRIRAWTIGSEIGRHFAGAPLAPDVTMRMNIVSGDHDPSDDRLGTFNALFPKGKYFGELSPIGPYNIVNVNPRITATITRNVSAGLAGMAYWRYARGDGVYDIPGNLIRAPVGGASPFVGKQLEATLDWQATPELELSGSLSAFVPGSFIRQTGLAKTIAMLGLESNFRF